MSETNERGRTARQELEILRMSLIRIAQALGGCSELPGSSINLRDRDKYGITEEAAACKYDGGWNTFAADCVQLAKDLALDTAEAWKRAKRYSGKMQAYEAGADALAKVQDLLTQTAPAIARLQATIVRTQEQTRALYETPEGQRIQQIVEKAKS